MRIQFKETIWSEIKVPESLQDSVLEMFKSGKIDDPNDLFSDEIGINLRNELLLETSEFIGPEFNQDNYPTIEIIGDNFEELWNNSITKP